VWRSCEQRRAEAKLDDVREVGDLLLLGDLSFWKMVCLFFVVVLCVVCAFWVFHS